MKLAKKIRHHSLDTTKITVSMSFENSMLYDRDHLSSSNIDIEKIEATKLGDRILYAINGPIAKEVDESLSIIISADNGLSQINRDKLFNNLKAIKKHCFRAEFKDGETSDG
jgi:hypothetical protein